MYGLPADTVRRKRTKIVPNNALNPIYDEEPFVFKKVVLPDLACLRIAAFEENGKFLGTRILPFVGLRPGYRHISLRSESMQPLSLPTLFVHITVKDYIPEGFSDLADALANPIAYQSMVEKHEKQLLALIDEGDDVSAAAQAGFGDQESLDKQQSTTDYQTSNKPNLSYSDSRSISGEEIITRSHHHIGMINRQLSQAEISLHSTTLMMKNDQLNKMIELNGGTKQQQQQQQSSTMTTMSMTMTTATKVVCSPTHKMSLIRQDTLNRKMKFHDDLNMEKLSSSLESTNACLDAESIETLKKSKNIQKIFGKIDRDLQTLQKKYEKLREKMKENFLQEKDEKFQQTNNSDKSKKFELNNISKSVKKIG